MILTAVRFNPNYGLSGTAPLGAYLALVWLQNKARRDEAQGVPRRKFSASAPKGILRHRSRTGRRPTPVQTQNGVRRAAARRLTLGASPTDGKPFGPAPTGSAVPPVSATWNGPAGSTRGTVWHALSFCRSPGVLAHCTARHAS